MKPSCLKVNLATLLILCPYFCGGGEPPRLPGMALASPKGAETFGGLRILSIIPTPGSNTLCLSIAKWTNGIAANLRMKIFYATNLMVPRISWIQVADLPASTTNTTITRPYSKVGLFVAGYTK